MPILLNGQQQNLTPAETLETLVCRTCKSPEHVIAELNGVIADRKTWASTLLKDGDKLELVTFVGGG